MWWSASKAYGYGDADYERDEEKIDFDVSDPDQAWLVRQGWKYRPEDQGARLGWWHSNIMSEPEPNEWMWKDDAVKFQLKISAGTRRW